MKEPFVFGKSVSGEYFTDRKVETQKLIDNFRYGVNTIIISPRRYGKTSLVKKAISEYKGEEIKFVFLDIFASRNPEEFCRMFADAVIKQTSSKLEEWAEVAKDLLSHLAPRFLLSSDPFNEISISFGVKPTEVDIDRILDLPQRIAMRKKCRVVVCIDEFQQVGEYPDSLYFQRKLRTHWQHHPDASYCLFGSKKHMMNELFGRSSYPFYKFGELFYLDKIKRDDWIPFIMERFQEADKDIDESTANAVCELADDYPSYVQQLAWLLWIKYDGKRPKETLDSAFEELMAHCSVLFEQQTQNLTSYQMNFLRALVEGCRRDFTKKEIMERYNLGTPGNISKIKTSLIKKELIDFHNGEYFIPDPILQRWLKRLFV